jgi:hypothetical protein
MLALLSLVQAQNPEPEPEPEPEPAPEPENCTPTVGSISIVVFFVGAVLWCCFTLYMDTHDLHR